GHLDLPGGSDGEDSRLSSWRPSSRVPRMRANFVVLCLPVVASVASAQAPNFTPAVRDYISIDAPVVALPHVKLIDGTGAAPAENQTIVISGGKIQAVGANVAVPAGAKVMDLTGHH